jgi:hypothetical protein
MTAPAEVLAGPMAGQGGAGAPSPVATAAPPVLPADLVAQARAANAYPVFCSIPPMPTDTPSATAFRDNVEAVRLAGARVALGSDAAHFTLSNTEPFAAAARKDATPPPPMTTPDEAAAEDFAATARRAAAPPPRSHQARSAPAGAKPAPTP